MKHLIYAALATVLAMSTAQTTAQTTAVPADGFTGIWYENVGGLDPNSPVPNKYGGGLATYPQQVGPIAIYRPEVNKTFFSFQHDPGDGFIRHAVSYFDHTTRMVARPQIWLNNETDDAHDAAVIAMDGDGYLYQFSMTHGEVRRSWIRKSASPYAIDGFVGLLSKDDPDDMAVFGNPASEPSFSGLPRFSYASAWYVPNAESDDKFLLTHTRYNNEQRDLYTSTSVDADQWMPRRSVAQIERGQYQTTWLKPDGKTLGTIFNVHPGGVDRPLDYRSDLYYMQTSDQATTWRTVDDNLLIDNASAPGNPLTSRPQSALVYASGPEERVYLKDVNYDADGNPVIMFLTSPDHNPRELADGEERLVKVARWSGSTWDVSTVTSVDHNYDHGSLYVETDHLGGEVLRIIAPFIDGPQQLGTGGEIGVWTSHDGGANWSLVDQLTTESEFNQTYVRRPLDADDDFYALWADGHAFEESTVSLYFSDRLGNVFRLPTQFDDGAEFAAPELVRAVPEPTGAAALSAAAAAAAALKRRSSNR